MTSNIRGTIVLLATVLMGLTLATGSVRAEKRLPAIQTPQAVVIQTPQAVSAADVDKPVITLKLLVTISAYEGEKRTSSQPFTLWVAADNQTTRFSTARQVPLPAANNSAVSTYQAIGTTIVATAAKRVGEGPFIVDLNVSDSSVEPGKTAGEMVTLTSVNANNRLYLRDGQKAEFLSITDKLTGVTTKIDVTATVLK